MGDAKPFLKAVNKALKEEEIFFEISRFKVAEDSLNATWTFEKSMSGIEEDELDAEIEALEKEVKAAHQKYLIEYADAVKVLYPNEYADLTDLEIRDCLSDPAERRSILLDTNLDPEYDPLERDGDENPVAYKRYIEFNNVPFFIDPEIDLLAFEDGGLQMGDLVKLDTSNEKGGTTLKFNKKGKSRLKLVLLDYVNIYKEAKNTIADWNGEELQVYKKKAFPRKVKLSKKAGGKQDVFVQDKMTQDGIPFVLITGQNNMYGTVLMRLKTGVYGSVDIRVGNYKDENHYYIESAD